MINLTKPIYSFQKHYVYKKHRKQLSAINSSKITPLINDKTPSLKKVRLKSSSFHQKQREQLIIHDNYKILNRLVDISNRKKSTLIAPYIPLKANPYNNGGRKIKQRMISEMNYQMAEKLITMPSTYNIKAVVRQMEAYEKLKKTLSNNRKMLYSSLHLTSIKTNSSNQRRPGPKNPQKYNSL